MLINQENFRNLYKNPIIIKDKEFAQEIARSLKIDSIMDDDITDEELSSRFKSLEVDESINAVLSVPYVDHTTGMSFFVMALASIDDNNITIFKREDNFSIWINSRKDKVDNSEFEYLENLNSTDEFDMNDYSEVVKRLDSYSVNDDVESLRALDILDNSRNEDYPDDLLTIFFKEGYNPEGMWVRYENILEVPIIEGTLLNTPNQDLGVEAGDKVKIFPYKQKEKDEWIIICNLDMV